MSSKIVTVTVQAVMFSALSTTVAQGISAWQNQRFPVIEPLSFLSFMIIAMIQTPPNYLYQLFLENTFPSKVPRANAQKADEKPEKAVPSTQTAQLSISNTAAKFVLDQSIGAAVNTILFIFLIGILKGKSFSTVGMDIQKDFWPMLTAGWTVWPMVTLANLLVVPFEYRMLVGNSVGVLWGAYMALKTM